MDNKTFWKNVKPLFSNKGNYGSKIKLVEKEEIIDDDIKIAEELNNFFKNAVASLNIQENQLTLTNVGQDSDPIDRAIKKFAFHPSILLIKNKIGKTVSADSFYFKEVTKAEVLKEINSINNKKATPFNTLPPKILKMSSEYSNDTLTLLVNKSFVDSRKFPSNLKLADITPTFKKNDPLAKENYRPVSVLPVVSKMQKQINSYISEYLSDLCGYRQGFST